MKKKIILIVLSIALIALIVGIYSLLMQRQKFKPTITYSICIWGDTTATASIKYIAKDRDSNVMVQEKNISMMRKQSEHALQKWNMIALKPSYFVNQKNIPFNVEVTSTNKENVYVALFENDTMPVWHRDSFLVFHLLMLRSAYDNNPDVAQKSLEEWMEKSAFWKGKNDSSKNLLAQSLWRNVQIVTMDSIAKYLQQINYPLFKILKPTGETVIFTK